MKSARDMFNDLGYRRFDYPGTVEYSIPNDADSIVIGPDTVLFEFDDKEVSLFHRGEHILLNMNVFKTIVKQLEELGWLDE